MVRARDPTGLPKTRPGAAPRRQGHLTVRVQVGKHKTAQEQEQLDKRKTARPEQVLKHKTAVPAPRALAPRRLIAASPPAVRPTNNQAAPGLIATGRPAASRRSVAPAAHPVTGCPVPAAPPAGARLRLGVRAAVVAVVAEGGDSNEFTNYMLISGMV